jgi:hypothetical protein
MASMKVRPTPAPLLDRRRVTTALLAAAATPLLRAQSPPAAEIPAGANLYTIELLLFRGGGGAAGEDLAAVAGNLSLDTDSAAATTPRSARLGEILPASRYKLGDAAVRLNASGNHKVIAHVAWTQTASAWSSGSGLTAEQLGLAASGLSGLVQLERGTYLHLGFSLTWAPTGGGHYALNEMRRVRFADRNYYDHPAFGIIALVSPGGEAR